MKTDGLFVLSLGLCLATCGCGNDTATVSPNRTPRQSNSARQSRNSAPDAPRPESGNPTVKPEQNPRQESPPGPWAGAKEFEWKYGQPEVTMMHRDEGFAYLTGVRGGMPGGSEVSLLPNPEGTWKLSGSDHKNLSGRAVACPWFVDAEWPPEMKVWRSRQGDFPKLIHRRDGFAVLLKIGGAINGRKVEFRLRVDDKENWRLLARSRSAGTRVRVAIIKLKRPGTFRGEPREHKWSSGDEPLRLIHKNDGIAFLSGLTGTFAGQSDYARVTLHEDGSWYLEGRSANKGDIIARAMTIRLSGTQTSPPVIAANDVATEPAPPKQDTIHGWWEIVEATDGGDKDEDLVGDVYVFSDDGKQFKIHVDGSKSNSLTIECNIDQENKQVDYSLASLKFLGLYKLAGDTLTLCFHRDERPTDFTSTAANENRLLVLKRISGIGGNSPAPTASTNPKPNSKAGQAIAALKKLGFRVSDDGRSVDIGYDGGERITDADLVPLRALPDVTELGLYGIPVTDKGLQNLAGLTNLRELTLNESKITDEGLRLIGRLSSLEALSLGTAEKVTGAGLAHLRSLTKMRSLSMGLVEVGPGELAFVGGMRDLESLIYSSSKAGLDESDIKTLGRLTKLHTLDFSGEKALNTGTLAHLSNLTGLEKLVLNRTRISDRAMLTVNKLPNLQRLELRETRIGDEGMQHLAGMASLDTIDLSRTRVTWRGLQTLKECPNISQLIMSGPGTTDRHLLPLKQWESLTVLDLSGDYDFRRRRPIPNRITNNGIKVLSEIKQLRALKLSDNPQINDRAVRYFIHMKNLHTLDLTNTGVTIAGARSISNAVKGLDRDELGIANE